MVTGLYSDTDYIATHVLSTVAKQSVPLYSPGNGPYSDTYIIIAYLQLKIQSTVI